MTDLDTLELVSGELLAADTKAKQLRERLYELVRTLYEAGERPIVIANAAGITKQRCNQIVNGNGGKKRAA